MIAAPPPIVQVERAVAMLQPFYVSQESVPENKRQYVCLWYADGKKNSIDFTWQVRVCRLVKKGPR